MNLETVIAASKRRTFSPLSLSPALWLSDSGSDPAQWDDLSGNLRHAVQATAENRPAIVAGALNGRQVRRFDGNDALYGSMGVNLTDCTLIAVQKIRVNSTAFRGIIATGYLNTAATTGGVAHGMIQFGAGQNNLAGTGFSPTTDGERTGDVGTNARVFSVVFSGLQLTSWLDGSVVVGPKTISSITEAGTQFRIGRGRTLTELFDGDIAEVLVFPTALSTTGRQRVERYLGAKWGITVA